MRKLLKVCILFLAIIALVLILMPENNGDLIYDEDSPLIDKPEDLIYTTKFAKIDATNAAKGFVSVTYLQDINSRVKVQIQKNDSENKYLYDIVEKDKEQVFPFTEGNGAYKIKIYKQTDNGKYAVQTTKELNITLMNEFAPFLNPSQYINYNDETKCVVLANEITSEYETEIEKVAVIFNYVVNNFKYDYDLAKNVQSGYIPDLDKVFDTKTGICFDYSATMAAMLRSQGIPCKMIFGYTGEMYHAWVNIYIKDIGWIDKVIQFNGTEWTLMDPTFVSTGNRSEYIMKYTSTKENYIEKYAY